VSSPPAPSDFAAALLGIADDIVAIVQAARQGQRVYLDHPFQMARAIRRLLKALNAARHAGRIRAVAQPTKPRLAIPNSSTLKLVTASCQRMSLSDIPT
jgi:DNA-binding NtrC family response regulator